jgi:hypothetical protein
MRLPIVLTLLVMFMLPADLDGLAADLGVHYRGATAAVAGFFDRNKDDSTIQVAAVRPAKTTEPTTR